MGEGLYYCPHCGSLVEGTESCPFCGRDLNDGDPIGYFEATAEDIEIEAALERAHGI